MDAKTPDVLDSSVSSLFVEDGILFLCTVPLLIYFFGFHPILLLLLTHFVSVLFAGLAHGEIKGEVIGFLLSFSICITGISDAIALLFCACQVFGLDFCCDVSKRMGTPCAGAISDPLVLFLIPLGCYNLFSGLDRAFAMYRKNSSRHGFNTAFLTCVYLVYSGLLTLSTRDPPSNVLAFVTCYCLALLLCSVFLLGTNSVFGIWSVFLLSAPTLIFQAHLSLRESDPSVYMVIPTLTLFVTGLLLLDEVPVRDAWTKAYAIATSVSAIFLFSFALEKQSAASGVLIIGYLSTFMLRSVFAGLDSHYLCLVSALLFATFDVIFITFIIFWNMRLPYLWLMIPSVLSLAVSVATATSKYFDIVQVRDDVSNKLNRTIDEEEIDVSNVGKDTHDEIIQACGMGMDIAHDMVEKMKRGQRDSTVESITMVLIANDTNGYVNPDAINTMRNRIFFIKGFMNKISSHVDISVYETTLKNVLLNLAIPRSIYESTESEGGMWALDVAWAPGRTEDASFPNVSLLRLFALRLKSMEMILHGGKKNKKTDEWLKKTVTRRYAFSAARHTFKMADMMKRYENHWNIVWL